MGAMKALLGDTPAPAFGGTTYSPERDQGRLKGQLAAVSGIMSDQQWHTLDEIARLAGGSEASVSARLRDLRKAAFGQHAIDRRHIERGLWAYRKRP